MQYLAPRVPFSRYSSTSLLYQPLASSLGPHRLGSRSSRSIENIVFEKAFTKESGDSLRPATVILFLQMLATMFLSVLRVPRVQKGTRSEEHTSELQSRQ